MASSDSPLGHSIGALQGSTVVSSDLSKMAARFSNSEFSSFAKYFILMEKKKEQGKIKYKCLTILVTLSFNQNFKNRKFLKQKKKLQTLYFNLGFYSS